MSNSYRRSKAKAHEPHTKWEVIYGTIASKLLRTGKFNINNAFSVAKFFGAFVYVFSLPYSFFKMLSIKIKVAKIQRQQNKE